jgi:hypothetical protein
MGILKAFCVNENEHSDGFRLGPAIVLFVLILTFIGSSLYILADSLA